MPKPRRMLSDIEAPHVQSLMRLIETQSKTTLANWGISYAEAHLLPIFEKEYPDDPRPRTALEAARDWMAGKVKLPQVRKLILDAHAAAREAEGNPAAQGAARAVGQAASTVHAATHSLGLALYGALAISYDRIGTDADWDSLSRVAAVECGKMEAALRAVAVEDEPHPAKIKWNC